MDYVALHISVADDDEAEIRTAQLADWPFESFERTGGELAAYIQAEALAPCRPEIEAWLRSEGIGGRFETIAAQNWNAVWERDFEPVDVEGRLLIRAPFHAPAPAGVREVIVTPQNAFGTGHHATTWLMARELLGMPLAGRRVLDLGSGTGVLAIVAVQCGAAQADAVDIDDWAEASCRENAAANGFAGRIEAIRGDVRCVAGRSYDVIVANINRNILLDAMPFCARMLGAGGTLLLSGFLEEDIPQLVAAAQRGGLSLTAVRSRDEWRLLRLAKEASAS